MSVLIGIQTIATAYNDFKAIVDSLPVKGNVYYSTGASYAMAFVSDDANYVVQFSGVSGSPPSSLAADFPNAILLANVAGFAV